MTATFLVIGGTGTIGRDVVVNLHTGGNQVRVLARQRDRALGRLPVGVEVVEGDLTKPDTLRPAFKGVSKAFVVTSDPSIEKTAFDAASDSGLDLVVKSSALGPGGEAPLGHFQSEQHLRQSGVPWVILRPSAFMQTLAQYLPALIDESDTFSLPGGRTGWIDTRDIAESATAVLTDDDPPIGSVYTLTGPASLSMDDIASDLSAVTGRKITYEPIPASEAAQAIAVRGVPSGLAQFLAAHYAAVERGDFDIVTHSVPDITRHPAHSWKSFLTDHPNTFAKGERLPQGRHRPTQMQ